MGPRSGTQVIRVGSKHFYLLGHLNGPRILITDTSSCVLHCSWSVGFQLTLLSPTPILPLGLQMHGTTSSLLSGVQGSNSSPRFCVTSTSTRCTISPGPPPGYFHASVMHLSHSCLLSTMFLHFKFQRGAEHHTVGTC